MTTRLLVTGSRTWDRPDVVWSTLDILAAELAAKDETQLVMVHGACFPKRDLLTGQLPETSADYLAYLWVRRGDHPLDVRHEPHPANWRQLGKVAGRTRNRAMAKLGADLCVAFHRGGSPGTTDMIRVAEEHDIPTHVIEYEALPEASHV